MEIVFHIGTNKTGTSAIQGFLSNNPEYLHRHGWVYPRTGRGDLSLHTELAHASGPHLQALVSDIEKEAQDNRVIISSEYLHTFDPSDFLDAFSGHDIRTVVFIRDHVSYLSSWYREGIKSQIKTYSFWDFVVLHEKPYYSWLHLWPNLTVVHYDRTSLINQSSIDHFLSVLDPSFQAPPPYEDKNASISGNLLFAKQLVNNIITYDERLIYQTELPFISEIDPSFSGSMEIPDSIVQYILEKYEYDRYVIEERYNIPLSPTPDSFQGFPSPNLKTWENDLHTIINFCEQNDFVFGKTLARLFLV